MKRSLRGSIPAPDTDDNFGTPLTTNDAATLSPSSSSTSSLTEDLFNPLTSSPTSTTLPPHQHGHHQPPNHLLEVTTILLWIVVVLSTVYYLVTEQTRRRRRLRRERQERLEVYSPKKQANRRVELVKVLKATTMTVQSSDLVFRTEGNFQEDCEKGFARETNTAIEDEPESSNDSTSDMPEDEDPSEEIQQLWCDMGQPLDISSSSWDEEEEEQWSLRLAAGDTIRQVPASCIICLKHFRVHDEVTRSPNHNNSQSVCPHAFHQQCIVEWLVKLPDCNCPICRHPFCQLASLKTKGRK